MFVKDIEGIVRSCGLEGLRENENGWVANSPFVPGDKGGHLYIGRDANSYHCKKSESKGHISELFAKMRGLSKVDAFNELLRMGYVESSNDDRGNPVEEIDPADKDAVESSVKEDEQKSVLSYTLKSVLNNGQDWSEVAKWRGLSKEVFDRVSLNGYFGHIPSIAGFGHCYAFLCYEMGNGGLGRDLKMIHCRHAIAENKDQWRSFGSYPIWIPEYRKDAKEIWMVEGQWDAITLLELFLKYSPRLLESIQIVALSGPKNIETKKSLLNFFDEKKVVQIIDEDQSLTGEKHFCKCNQAFSGLKKCDHQLLRIPKEIRADCKDLNDWYKKGITKDQFMDWTECIDTQFSVSSNGLCDLEFKEKHGIPLNKLVILDEDGNPNELYVPGRSIPEPISNYDLLELVKPCPILYEFLKECIAKNEAPPLWHLTSFLTYFAAIIGRRFKHSNGLYPNLYVLNCGPSGIGKSSSIYQLQGCASEAMKGICLPNNFSSESFLDELATQNQKMWVCDEFAAWVRASDTSYKNFAAMTLINMFDMHYYSENNPYEISFKKQKLSISHPSVSILAACVIDQLSKISNENLKAGLIGRFMFAIGRNCHADYPHSSHVSAVMKMRITELFKGVLKTPIQEFGMQFSPGANEMFEREFLKSKNLLINQDATDNMQTYTSRMRARLIKLSMIFELLMPIHKWPMERKNLQITEQAMVMAIRLDRVFNKCFLEIFEKQFEEEDDGYASFNNKLQRKIVRFLERPENKGTASLREIRRYAQEDSVVLEKNLKALKDQTRIVETKKMSVTNRPSIFFSLINPIKIVQKNPEDSIKEVL